MQVTFCVPASKLRFGEEIPKPIVGVLLVKFRNNWTHVSLIQCSIQEEYYQKTKLTELVRYWIYVISYLIHIRTTVLKEERFS